MTTLYNGKDVAHKPSLFSMLDPRVQDLITVNLF